MAEQAALVTGASRGIGAAICRVLVADGFRVHAVARGQAGLDRLREELGERLVPLAGDAGDVPSIMTVLADKPIDVLVNNAGALDTVRPVHEQSLEETEATIRLNLIAPLQLIQALLPGMIDRRRGHIINITSIAGHYEFGGHTAYHATKAAMHTVSRQLRVDAYGHNVRVTEISPGRVATDIFAKAHGLAPAEARKQFLDDYDLPTTDDIADAVIYALGAPRHVNIGMIEIMPTLQVPGGLRTGKKREASHP